ncbi:MAG: c-type cytochrome [Gammaproteobacteria bacterium]|nr:c-type cytochrome [Gammaproteobacteria bacterium]
MQARQLFQRINHLTLFIALLGVSFSATVFAVESPSITTGKQLYEENCIFCHQENGIGQVGIAPSLTNKELLSIATDKFLIDTIRDGQDGTSMAAFGVLGTAGIQAIVAYLRSFEKIPNRAAEVDKQPDAFGDPRLGKQWYEQICSTCHGMAGEGYAAGGSGTAIGKSGFLSKASDGFIRETIRIGRSNTAMYGFQGPMTSLADLDDREIDDIIVYLRSLPTYQATME